MRIIATLICICLIGIQLGACDTRQPPPPNHDVNFARPDGPTAQEDHEDTQRKIWFFHNGGNVPHAGVPHFYLTSQMKSVDELTFIATQLLHHRSGTNLTLYTHLGFPLEDLDVLLDGDAVYALMEGDYWKWPCHFINKSINLGTPPADLNLQDDPVFGKNGIHPRLKTVSTSPHVLVIDNVLTDTEIEWIINTSQNKVGMERSQVSQKGDVADYRTSFTAWIHYDDFSNSSVVQSIDNRARFITRINYPWHQAEDLQVVKYDVSQKYEFHFDAMDSGADESEEDEHGNSVPSRYPPEAQRYLTLLFYLTDVEDGGETAFAHANGHRFNGDHSICQGLKVKPKKGSAVLFYNLLSPSFNGLYDRNSLHMGCPVGNGTKFICNKWLWNKEHYRDVLEGPRDEENKASSSDDDESEPKLASVPYRRRYLESSDEEEPEEDIPEGEVLGRKDANMPEEMLIE